MFDPVRSEESTDGLEPVAGHEQDGLPEVPYSFEFHEPRISVRLPVCGDGVAEHEAADPRALQEIGAIHVPRDDVSDQESISLPTGATDGSPGLHFTQLSKNARGHQRSIRRDR